MQVDEGNPSRSQSAEGSQPEEGHYEVEKLSKIRRVGSKHPTKPLACQYEVLVSWKGYSDITWEPLENLIHDVPEMVDEFLELKWGVAAD